MLQSRVNPVNINPKYIYFDNLESCLHSDETNDMFLRSFIWLTLAQNLIHMPVSANEQAGADASTSNPQSSVVFNIASKDAEEAIIEFVDLVDIPVIYLIDEITGIKLNAVRGEMKPEVAIRLMVEGTALEVEQDTKSGTLLLKLRDRNLYPENGNDRDTTESVEPKLITPMTEKNRSNRLRNLFAAMMMALLPPAGEMVAQDDLEDEENIFLMSPFTVSTDADTGYRAQNTLAGGRLSTRLEDTPSAIQALTTVFINDIAATDFIQASRYALNAVNIQDVAGIQIFNDYRIDFRGIGGNFQARNYFQWYINSDNYSAEQLQFARGPNSIVFGDAGVGGLSNIDTKRATNGVFTELQAQLTSWGGGGRLTLDHNRTLVEDTLFVRAGAMIDHSDGWRDNESYERDGYFATATWRPLEKTEVRVEVENGSNAQFWGSMLRDQVSGWDGVTTVSERMSGHMGDLRRLGNDYLVWNPSNPEIGIVNWQGWGQTRAAGNQTSNFLTNNPFSSNRYPTLPDEEYNFQAPNRVVDMDFETQTIFLEQQVGDSLFFEIAYNHTVNERYIQRSFWDNYRIDVNEFMPDGITPNPHFLEHYADANPFEDLQSNEHDHYRVSAAYVWEGMGMRHRFLASFQQRDGRFDLYEWRHSRTNGSRVRLDDSRNRIRIRRYESQLADDFTYGMTDAISGIDVKRWLRRRNGNEQSLTSYQVAANSDWLNGRLTSILGWRYDELTVDSFDRIIDPDTREVTGTTPLERDREEDNTSLTAGLVYDLTDTFSLVANYGESYLPQSERLDINGRIIGGRNSEGMDFGIRATFFEGKLYTVVNYYTNEENQVTQGGQSGNINETWQIINENLNQNNPEVQDGYNDTFSREAQGWELEIIGNITEQWRVNFNIAFPETEQTGGFSDTIDYVAQNRATWVAAVDELNSLGLTAEADDIQDNIVGIDRAVTNFAEGRTLNGLFDYQANIYTRYDFAKDGKFSGWFIGGGANFRGDRLATNRDGDAFDYIYSDAYTLINSVIGYKTTLWGKDFQVQFNVDNLFDEQSDQISNGSRIRTITVEGETLELAQNRFFLTPRRMKLTATLRF